ASVVIRAEEPKAPQVFPEGATGILESVSPEGSEEVSAENTTEEAPISAKEMIEGRNVPLQERSFLHTGIATIRDGHPILINSHVAKPERAAEGSDPGLSLSSREDGSDRFGVTGSEADWQGGWHLNNPEKNIALGKAYKEYLRKSTGASEFEDLSVVRKSGSSVTATFGKR
ncbi:MAG: hypothetical protein KDD64_12040, partial [Bdellovibrionales bacterium]|nr:hypothetical protein [Bdellovibrionales bacterium]